GEGDRKGLGRSQRAERPRLQEGACRAAEPAWPDFRAPARPQSRLRPRRDERWRECAPAGSRTRQWRPVTRANPTCDAALLALQFLDEGDALYHLQLVPAPRARN